MDSSQIERPKAFASTGIIDYYSGSVCCKIILKKDTGSVRVMSFDAGIGLKETRSPFDIFAQIIEGKAEIEINKTRISLESGQSVIIPAHSSYKVKANERFKIILTVTENGYE